MTEAFKKIEISCVLTFNECPLNYFSKFGRPGRVILTLKGMGWFVSDCF